MDILNTRNSTIDAELSLKNEFKDDTSNSLIILNAYNISLEHTYGILREKYDKIIIYNFESYDNKFGLFLNLRNINLIKDADEVWDYDEENIKRLSHIRNDIKLHTLKPFINIEPQEKEYDVLFYGLINERRSNIINKLQKENINIKVLTNTFGDKLNDYIAKSKCLLNVHYYDSKLQEQARMIRWINNGKIFSEKSKHNYLNVNEYEYNDLVGEIKKFLNNNQ